MVGSLALGAVIGLAASLMAFSMITMFRPAWLQAAEPSVCSPGTTLELSNASPVPGELVLEAVCVGAGAPQDVTGRFLVTVMGTFFAPTFLLASLTVWVRG
jgi:hypothetical protein